MKHAQELRYARSVEEQVCQMVTGDRMYWTYIIWAMYSHIRGDGSKVQQVSMQMC